jgi:hypothetical protein
VFRLNRDAFLKLTESAVSTYRATREFTSPPNSLYERMAVYDLDGFIHDRGLARWETDYGTPPAKIIIEFIMDDFYRPLVFVANDNADEVYDTCSSGGAVVNRIEPHWYICSRDWN